MHNGRSTTNAQVRSTERGGALVFLSVALVPLIALLALCIDGFSLMVSKLEQENNSEFAALAALNDGIDPTTGLLLLNRDTTRTKRAELIAGSNMYFGNRAAQQVKINDIATKRAGKMTLGFYNKNTRRFIEKGSCLPGGQLALNAIRLSLNTTAASNGRTSSAMMPIFSRMLGHNSFSMESATVVYYDKDRKLSVPATRDTNTSARNSYDVNGDGTVNITDYNIVSEALSSDSARSAGTSLAALGKECYDLDGNNIINLTDLINLQTYLRDNSDRR